MAGVSYHEAARPRSPPPDADSRLCAESSLEQLEQSNLEQLEEFVNYLEVKRQTALRLINEKKPMDDTNEATELSESETDTTSDGENVSDQAKLLETVPTLQDDTLEEIPPRVVMAFVKELEEAHSFYDLKIYLREHFKELDYDLDNIFQCIVEKVESHSTFDIDQEAIWRAVQEHITEVRTKRFDVNFAAYVENKLKQKLRYMFGESDEYTTAQHEYVYTKFPGLRNVQPAVEPPEEPPVLVNLLNPVFKLVHETREQKPAYEMDNDPQVELRKIKKSNPMYYGTHFIYQRPPVDLPKNTITVSNLRPDATTLDVKELLKSCGKKLHYEVERGKRNALMIHVTFKEAGGAKKALDMESPSLDGKPVLITDFETAPDRLKPEDMRDPSADEVLLKYRKLIISLKKETDVVEVVTGGNCPETSAASTVPKICPETSAASTVPKIFHKSCAESSAASTVPKIFHKRKSRGRKRGKK